VKQSIASIKALVGAFWTREAGAIAVTAALSIVALVGIAGFAIDIGHAYSAQRVIQASAEAAAAAGKATSAYPCISASAVFYVEVFATGCNLSSTAAEFIK
jgi:Flp pilus assembly protein TadG